MQYQTTRKLARSVHFSIAAFQLLYVYTPLHHWEYALPIVQWVTFPLLMLSGFWLVRGKVVWRKTSLNGGLYAAPDGALMDAETSSA